MQPKKKALALAKPAKTRKAVLKEKPATMSKKEWDDDLESVESVTLDRKRRRFVQIEKEARAAATAAMPSLGLGGADNHVYQATPGTHGSTNSPSYSAYFEERHPSTPLSQIQFSNDMADSSAAEGSATATQRGPDITPSLRRGPTDGHVTDGTGLSRSLFSDGGIYVDDAPNAFEQMTGERFEYGDDTSNAFKRATDGEARSGLSCEAGREYVPAGSDEDEYSDGEFDDEESDIVDVETCAIIKKGGTRGAKVEVFGGAVSCGVVEGGEP